VGAEAESECSFGPWLASVVVALSKEERCCVELPMSSNNTCQAAVEEEGFLREAINSIKSFFKKLVPMPVRDLFHRELNCSKLLFPDFALYTPGKGNHSFAYTKARDTLPSLELVPNTELFVLLPGFFKLFHKSDWTAPMADELLRTGHNVLVVKLAHFLSSVALVT